VGESTLTVGGTEARHELGLGLQALPPAEVLAHLLQGQRDAAARVAPAIPALEAAARVAAGVLAAGGRLAYAGAGSSGLMALSDALELAGTFGIPPERTPMLFAGGAEALVRMAGAVEDDSADALADVVAAGLGPGDAIICVSASGGTPYTVAVAEAVASRGGTVIAMANVAGSRLLALGDVAVLLDTGAELVAGSTRMGAATAQKIALNMISTLVGLMLGHVHDGYMVNVVADNAKLRGRAARIVADLAGIDGPAAGARSAEDADRLLAGSGGHLGAALDALRAENRT
jgi:N-acetylmuramic acid 6-phosphate etherase